MIGLQKVIAAAMILGSSMLASQVLNDYAFPGVLCMLGLLGLQRRFIWYIKPQRRIIRSLLFLLLLVIFTIHYRFGGMAGIGRFAPTAEMAWQTISRFFLAAMILVLYLGSSHVLPPTLALFHLGFCISSGQILLLESYVTGYRGLELGAVVLTTFYVITSQPIGVLPETGRPYRSGRALGAFVTLILITINVGWILGSVMYQHQGRLTVLGGLLWGERFERGTTAGQTAVVGFSKSGIINNVLQIIEDPDQEPILTITGDVTNPMYLRARAFDDFRESIWHTYANSKRISPIQNRLPDNVSLPAQTQVFKLTEGDEGPWNIIHIKQRLKQSETMFTPLGCGYVEITARRLLHDKNNILSGPRTINEYMVAYSNTEYGYAPGLILRQNQLALPTTLDPRIRSLADEVFVGCRTTQDKIRAVKAYFRTNYTYQLGMDAPLDQDPVTYFLLEGSTGYCEYFATGAALLLRLANIPTRYVTGFLVTERDVETRAWLARNAHAHAWVEAWDDDTGKWAIVEATPEEEIIVPDVDQTGNRSRFSEFIRNFNQTFYEYGILGAALWLLMQPSWAPSGLVIVVLAARWLWRRWQNRQGSSSSDDLISMLHRALRKMDRRVRRQGYRRSPNETLHCFAARLSNATDKQALQPLAQWYRHYADLRYCRVPSPQLVQELVNAAVHHRSKSR